MSIGLSPGTAPLIKSESVAISTSYPKFVNNLLAAKHCLASAAHLPNKSQRISVNTCWRRG